MFRILSMSYQDRAYPIPSPEVKRFLQDQKGQRPRQILIYIYIYLTKPQKSRKQNGITGFPSHDPEDASPNQLPVQNKQGKTHFFLPLGAEPAGTLHIYYLKQTRLLVKTGTGIRELHTPRQVSC
jgi:hypothetical protein